MSDNRLATDVKDLLHYMEENPNADLKEFVPLLREAIARHNIRLRAMEEARAE